MARDLEPITHAELMKWVDYNPWTGVFIARKSRKKCRAGNAIGTVMGNGYIRITLRGRNYLAHRLAWFYMNEEWPPEQIDHINGQRDDNRIENLRCATPHQNAHNKASTRPDGVVGVSPQRGKYVATIGVRGKRHYLGSFSTYEAAVRARRRAEKKFGIDIFCS